MGVPIRVVDHDGSFEASRAVYIRSQALCLNWPFHSLTKARPVRVKGEQYQSNLLV
jgi:hypothetical protein